MLWAIRCIPNEVEVIHFRQLPRRTSNECPVDPLQAITILEVEFDQLKCF